MSFVWKWLPQQPVLPEVGRDPALELESARWCALLSATEDAILLADARGNLKLSNSAASRLFDSVLESQDEDDSTGRSVGLLAHTLSSSLLEVFQSAVRDQSTHEAEVSITHPLHRTLHVRITPVSDNEFLIILRDLTELRRLERVRRDFVANVSHELRTPLTSIKAMAETLLDGAREDETVAPRFLLTIIHESDRLVRLSSDLLDLSRIEARGLVKTPVDLDALVRDVVSRLCSNANKAGIRLINNIRTPVIVPADKDEIGQVLVNLLDNAMSYTQRGGQVTLSSTDKSDSVSISIADTGFGILSHDIPRIFERFYRADKARSRASGGTGLGLSIVKHIIESHEGTVGVESEFNKGSVFTFTLPK